MKKILPAIAACSLAAGILCSCSQNKFSVEGTVDGAKDGTVVLERQDPVAGWIALDSTSIGNDGDFRFQADRPEYPELYRLSYRGSHIYLPIDSLENLTLTTKASSFASGFTLAGSPQAEALTSFERELARVQKTGSADSMADFRKRVYNQYLRDAQGNILSYYILSRPVDGGFLIDYTDPLYTAVATAFQTYRPDDPHTARLAERARQGQAERRRAAGKTTRMQATATGMIPITLPDSKGDQQSLQNLLGKGKPVIVAFVVMTREDTPAINRSLRKFYDSGKADIYEVCLDVDQFAWRQASQALPWTVVIDPHAERSTAALNYNVGSLPAFFIYNSSGDLVQSTGNTSELDKLLSITR